MRYVLAYSGLFFGACVVDLPHRHFDQGTGPDAAGETRPRDTRPSDMPKPDQTLCGNGRVDPGELCDTAISDLAEGGCPQTSKDCPDFDPCTTSRLEGGTGCQAHCVLALVTTCGPSDGCCPAACANLSTSPNNDSDCPRPITAEGGTCGNGVVNNNKHETCDKNCPTSCEPKACNNGQIVGSAKTCTARCLYFSAPAGTACHKPNTPTIEGRCHDGTCCTGCWNGKECASGDTGDACGHGGGACQICSLNEKCCYDFTCKPSC